MSETIQDKIGALEAEMARTQKNKATNYHLGTYGWISCDRWLIDIVTVSGSLIYQIPEANIAHFKRQVRSRQRLPN
jgi:hypothetical protein